MTFRSFDKTASNFFFFFFFTLVTGHGRSLSLKLSDERVYEPPLRARLGTAGGMEEGDFDSTDFWLQRQPVPREKVLY